LGLLRVFGLVSVGLKGIEKKNAPVLKGENITPNRPCFFVLFCEVILKQTTCMHVVSMHCFTVLKCQPLLLTHELLPNEILILDG